MTQSEKQKRSVDFSIKATWLAIAKLYNEVGQEQGISHSTGFVLLNIDREKGTPATKIAPLMGMEARSLTRLLKTMEEIGMIYRETGEDDKRKVIIKLTEEGKRKREFARQTVKTFYSKIQNLVSNEDLEIFFKVITNINQAIQGWENELQINESLKVEEF